MNEQRSKKKYIKKKKWLGEGPPRSARDPGSLGPSLPEGGWPEQALLCLLFFRFCATPLLEKATGANLMTRFAAPPLKGKKINDGRRLKSKMDAEYGEKSGEKYGKLRGATWQLESAPGDKSAPAGGKRKLRSLHFLGPNVAFAHSEFSHRMAFDPSELDRKAAELYSEFI